MCDHENDCMDWSDEDYFLCKVLDICTSFALFPTGSLGSLRDLAELLVPFFLDVMLSLRPTRPALRRLLKPPVLRMSSTV